MKKCPQCGREYDNTMMFCLDDGAELVYGPASSWASPTRNLPSAVSSENEVTAIFQTSPLNKKPDTNTIAVLPFANIGDNDEAEFFADGLAEELLSVLAKVRGLKVAARTSSFSFKGKQAMISEVGRLLNVASILEGSIRIIRDRVRVSVKLVSVDDGFQIWAETYDRTLDDIFEVQDDIARSVVIQLDRKLVERSVERSGPGMVTADLSEALRGRAKNPKAQLYYLQGRFLIDRFNVKDVTAGIDYLTSAVETEPDCALFWAELSRAYGLQTQVGGATEDEGYSRSRECAERALTIIPDLIEGHVRMGWIKMFYDWDYQAARASFQTALELGPDGGQALAGMAALQCKLANFEESIRLNLKVLENDPLNAPVYHNLGISLQAAGRNAEAEQVFRKALEIAPQRYATRAYLSMTLAALERADEAFSEAASEPYEVYRLYSTAIVCYTIRQTSDADEALREMIEKYADSWAFQIAEVYSAASKNDAAFDWLERARVIRDGGVTNLLVSPWLNSLKTDPRWARLRSELGFSETPTVASTTANGPDDVTRIAL